MEKIIRIANIIALGLFLVGLSLYAFEDFYVNLFR